jgi:hypothetical protein
MHAKWCSTPHLARLIPAATVGDTVMPDRRQVATGAIVAAGVYLHPNYYVGDQDKRLTAIQSDSPIADIDADFLESWMWAKLLSKTQFSRRSTIQR